MSIHAYKEKVSGKYSGDHPRKMENVQLFPLTINSISEENVVDQPSATTSDESVIEDTPQDPFPSTEIELKGPSGIPTVTRSEFGFAPNISKVGITATSNPNYGIVKDWIDSKTGLADRAPDTKKVLTPNESTL